MLAHWQTRFEVMSWIWLAWVFWNKLAKNVYNVTHGGSSKIKSEANLQRNVEGTLSCSKTVSKTHCQHNTGTQLKVLTIKTSQVNHISTYKNPDSKIY